MTARHNTFTAVFLAALMVLSVVAGTAAVAGAQSSTVDASSADADVTAAATLDNGSAKALTISWFRDPGEANGPYPVAPNEYEGNESVGIELFTNAEGDRELIVDNSTARNPNGKWDMLALHVETDGLEALNPPTSGGDKGLVTQAFLDNESWDLTVEQVGGDKSLDIAANQENFAPPELSAATEAEIPPVMVFADTEEVEGDITRGDEPDTGLYVWVDPNRATLNAGGETGSFETGEEYEATFEVEGQTETVSFEMVGGGATMNDSYAPANSFNQGITANTTLMTGSSAEMVMVPDNETRDNQTASIETEGNLNLQEDDRGTIPYGFLTGQFDFSGMAGESFDVHLYAPGYTNETLSSDFRDQAVLLEPEYRIEMANGSGTVRDVLQPDYTIDNATIRDSKTMTIAYTNPDHDTPEGIGTQIGDGHASGDSTIAYNTNVNDSYYDEMWLHYETSTEIFEAIDLSPGRDSVEKFESSPLSLNVTQTNAEDGTPLSLDLSENSSGVYVVPDNGSSDPRIYNSSQGTGLFFSFKLNEMAFFEDGERTQPDVGDEFEATLTIDTEQGERTETTTFRIVEGQAVAVTPGDEIRLQQAEEADVQFNATLARGTAMSIRLVATADNGTVVMDESTGELGLSGLGPQICCDGPSTAPWGTISATFDTSDLPVGTSVTAYASVVADLPDAYETPLVVQEISGEIRGQPTGSVSIGDQSGSGESITVDSVELSDGGFVSVHTGSPQGPTIGETGYLEAGSQEGLEVALSEPVSEDATLYVLVHQDTNFNEEFDFPADDGAYLDDAGEPVSTSIAYTVESAATATATPSPTSTATATATAAPTDTPADGGDGGDGGDATPTETSSGDGPGFGLAAALVALLAAALLARRRD
jgi:PGF-CTERM protein/surface glycoprotein (TIGR04207 family)